MEEEGKSKEEEHFEEFRRLRDEAADKQVKQVEIPRQPTVVEREEHRLHHANFEPLCETCIIRGRERIRRSTSSIPTTCFSAEQVNKSVERKVRSKEDSSQC